MQYRASPKGHLTNHCNNNFIASFHPPPPTSTRRWFHTSLLQVVIYYLARRNDWYRCRVRRRCLFTFEAKDCAQNRMKKSVFSHVKTIFQTVVVVILCDFWILSRCQNPYVSGHLFVASLTSCTCNFHLLPSRVGTVLRQREENFWPQPAWSFWSNNGNCTVMNGHLLSGRVR